MSDNRPARTTLELTLNPEYVRDWNVWEAIREFLQNALDSQDLGYESSITYVTNTKQPQLRIITEGITIDRDTLLLGTTSKAGRSDQRGEFGEGMKLACLVLTRNGLGVRIKSGDEQWMPRIAHSKNFNSDLLVVDTAPCVYRNRVQVDIIGLNEEDWKTIQKRILHLNKPKDNEIIHAGENKILIGERFINQLYVKGIFVGKLPGNYFYGYDLSDVSLDRDRRLADPWDLKYAIHRALAKASNDIPVIDLMTIMNGEFEESNAVAANAYSSSNLSKKILEEFQKQHGENAIAVSDTAQSIEAKHYGFDAVVVSKGMKTLIELEIGDFETKKNKRRYDIKQRYSSCNLTEEEELNLMWCYELLSDVETIGDVIVADFFDKQINGLYRDGVIYIAKKWMIDRIELMRVAIHEAAHAYGKDGEKEHEVAEGRIAAKIIVNLSK